MSQEIFCGPWNFPLCQQGVEEIMTESSFFGWTFSFSFLLPCLGSRLTRTLAPPPHSYFSQQVCDYDPLVLFLYKEPNYFFCPLETNEVKKVLMVTSSDRDANTLRTAVRGYWRFSWLRRPDFVFRLNLVHSKERKKQREGDWWCNHNERSRNSSTNCINVHALFSRTVLYGSYKWLHCLRLYNGRHIIHRELMGLLMNTSFLVTTWVKVYIFDLNSLEM